MADGSIQARSNYSVFERNVMDAFRGVTDNAQVLEEADAMFLRGAQRDRLAAERAALDWCQLGESVASLLVLTTRVHLEHLPNAAPPDGHHIPELYAFFRERAYRQHLPGN